jgi:hypothetical protein
MFEHEVRPDTSVARTPSLQKGRQEIIERVYEAAEPEFIAEYRSFLIEYAEWHEDFIAGDVTSEYETRSRDLTSHEKKALGGLYQSLQKEGIIEKTGGYRKRDQGSPAAVYRLKNINGK